MNVQASLQEEDKVAGWYALFVETEVVLLRFFQSQVEQDVLLEELVEYCLGDVFMVEWRDSWRREGGEGGRGERGEGQEKNTRTLKE